jgi:hypothetical protein
MELANRHRINTVNISYKKNKTVLQKGGGKGVQGNCESDVLCDGIAKVLSTNDETLIVKFHQKICGVELARIQLMEYLLLNGKIQSRNVTDIKTFFNSIKTFCIHSGFVGANFKTITNNKNSHLIVQFSTCVSTYKNKMDFVQNINKLFERSGLQYVFFKLANRRYRKTVDLLWCVTL